MALVGSGRPGSNPNRPHTRQPGQTQDDVTAQAEGQAAADTGVDFTQPDLPGGFRQIGAAKVSVGDVGKITALAEAFRTFRGFESRIVNPITNEVDRTVIAAGQEVLGFQGIPFTQGRQVRQEFRDALESRIRIESGAAVPEAEIDRMMDRLFPAVFDTDQAIRSKLKRTGRFFSGSLTLFDVGRGILSPSTVNAANAHLKRTAAGTPTQPTGATTTRTFDELSEVDTSEFTTLAELEAYNAEVRRALGGGQ